MQYNSQSLSRGINNIIFHKVMCVQSLTTLDFIVMSCMEFVLERGKMSVGEGELVHVEIVTVRAAVTATAISQ